jgi:2'-5' RNA ligase
VRSEKSEGNGGEVWRLFIAIPVPEFVKTEMENAQAELRAAIPSDCVRWTRREQFHLTLKFLGDVDSRAVDELIMGLKETCKGRGPIPLQAGRIGCFPDLRHPRVIWAWVHDAKEQLVDLQRVIETVAGKFTGEKSEENFTGHVTLGRTKGIKREQAESLTRVVHSMTNRFFGEWTANTAELIRSELNSGGSRYTTLATIPLSAGRN